MIREVGREYERQGEFFVNKQTGEAIHKDDMNIFVVPPDYKSDFQSPAEIKHKREMAKMREEKEARRKQRRSRKGQFIFIDMTHDFRDIEAATMARLIYLATYASYDKAYLSKGDGTPLMKTKLPELLGVSKSTAWRFYDEVAERYLTIDQQGRLCLPENTPFIRGKKKPGPCLKAYINCVRDLYSNTPTSKHKTLGYVYQMLEFVNFEYNILCRNPKESEWGKIEAISFDEFCDYCGYERDKRSVLQKTYSQLTFYYCGQKQPVVLFLSDGNNLGNSKVFLNPNVIYSGSDIHKIEVLTETTLQGLTN